MKLLDLYESILKTGNLVVTSDGCVSKLVDDDKEPFLIKGKRVVLPTKEHLSNPNWKERIVFHPLSENVLRKESDVIEEFRGAIIGRLNFTVGVLATDLLMTVASEAEHSKLNPDQSEILSILKKASQKTVDTFIKIMRAMDIGSNKTSFVHIYLKRAGSVGGVRYQRAGIVTFPIYDELISESGTVFGVKVDAKEKKILIKLFEYIFPTIKDAGSYSRGSNSGVAPYLDALMKSVIAIGGPINDQINLFENVLENSAELLFNDDWVETFDNLDVMVPEIRAIPMQAGNEGKADVPVVQTQPVAAQPVAQQTNIFGQPVATQPAPQVVMTPRGADIDSLIRSNPALAQSLGQGGGSVFMNQNNMERAPSWARAGGGNNNQGGWGNNSSVFQQGGWNNGSGTAL